MTHLLGSSQPFLKTGHVPRFQEVAKQNPLLFPFIQQLLEEIPIGMQDGRPESGISGGNASSVPESRGRKGKPLRRCCQYQGSRQRVWQMTDSGYHAIVILSSHFQDLGT
jgi:hypothetical protein